MDAMEKNPEIVELEDRLRKVTEERNALNEENAHLWADLGNIGADRDRLRAENALLRHTLDQMEAGRQPESIPYPVLDTQHNMLLAENTRLWNLLQNIFGGNYEFS